ncbi:glycosyltransferase family 4 protein [Stygiolobus caldivivus]|uniref:Glycosyl transferase n=1 Tax=Stygiolobus caldivivus TaxID=2824673 RepID=A0A8D5U448_9CREN|nr:glycosyltransferase family 4 protein [Stygiolobus caldivivus]BCU69041.1 glycosyl transferase [Stygiolobus caldivivus]
MEKAKEILTHVTHTFYPVVGGIEKVIYETARRQAKKYEVYVVTSDKNSGQIRGQEFTVKQIRSLRFFNMPDLTYPLGHDEILAKSNIIHFHSQNSLFSIKLLENSSRFKAKKVFTLMAVDSLKDHPNKIIRTLSHFYSRYTISKVLTLSDALIVKNERDRKILREKYNKDPYLVPDGIDELYFNFPYSENFKKEKLKGEDYILYIGRLHKLKGVDILIESCRFLNTKVVFIGPGNVEYYKLLSRKKGVGEKCIFLGYLSEEEKISAIDGSSVVVIPSISDYVEAFSLVLSEAWSRGKAVVASSVGSLTYRIRNGINGILVKPNDPKDLAFAINKIINDKELARKLGEEGKKEVMGWDKVISLLDGIYNKLKNE